MCVYVWSGQNILFCSAGKYVLCVKTTLPYLVSLPMIKKRLGFKIQRPWCIIGSLFHHQVLCLLAVTNPFRNWTLSDITSWGGRSSLVQCWGLLWSSYRVDSQHKGSWFKSLGLQSYRHPLDNSIIRENGNEQRLFMKWTGVTIVHPGIVQHRILIPSQGSAFIFHNEKPSLPYNSSKSMHCTSNINMFAKNNTLKALQNMKCFCWLNWSKRIILLQMKVLIFNHWW